MSEIYYPQKGDVIMNNGVKHVVVGGYNHETPSHCSYERGYDVMPLENLLEQLDVHGQLIPEETMNMLKYTIYVKGTKFPVIKKCEDEAPFEMNMVQYAKIKRKQPRMIKVWE